MARSKGNNPYSNQLRNASQIGGNHQARTVPGILKEGAKTHKDVIEQKLRPTTPTPPTPSAPAQAKPTTPKR